MLLTIIIPHYNLPRPLLERCLESVKRQHLTTSELEVLIIDDESENPPLWVKDMFPEFQLICAKHGGLGSARNVGMSKAAGEYLFFLDSDDFIHPQLIEIAYGLAHDHNADLVNFEYYSENKEKFVIKHIHPSDVKFEVTNNPIFKVKREEKYRIHNVIKKQY